MPLTHSVDKLHQKFAHRHAPRGPQPRLNLGSRRLEPCGESPDLFTARIALMPVQPELPEPTTELWGQVLAAVQVKLETQQAFDTWLKPIVPLNLTPQLVELEVPNQFFIDWIHQYHLGPLRQSLREVLGADPEVRFSARERTSTTPAPESPTPVALPAPPPAPAAPRGDRTWLDSRLNPRLTFGSFV